MSFFAKGDFKIQQSWNDKKSNSKSKRKKSQVQPQQNLMMKLGMNPQQPSTDIIDDSLSQLLMKQRSYDYSAKSTKATNKVPKSKPPIRAQKKQDQDLLSSMSKRLQKLQKTCQNQRLQIKEKNLTIQKIKTENAFLKGMKEDSSAAYKDMEELRQKNAELTKKVEEMQIYLKQYGLKWVGNKVHGNLEHNKIKKQITQAKSLYKLPSQIDINTIKKRVQQLNAGLQSEGQGTEIYSDHGIHKFRKTEHLPIAFYSNGIVIKNFNYFPYKSKESLRILSDLVDGYFPYIFKEKYPNGVLLQVVDMVESTYTKEIGIHDNINTFESVKNKQFQPQSKDQFLNKLPKQVIKNGKVIPIRDEIGKLFDGQKQKTIQLQDHYEIQEGEMILRTECHVKVKNNLLSLEQVCTLKIRSHSGQIYFMRMEKEEKMMKVIENLSKLIKQNFKVMGNYPRRQYTRDDDENLEELGFFPNANLHLQIVK